MKILVDENIPLARELFGSLGDVTFAAGRDVDEDFPGLERFDVLAIRSVTRVTTALVDRAACCRVIGTATIGTDHVDLAYIQEANRRRENPIAVFSAPGSNADSVADYVWFALARLTEGDEEPLAGRSLGIVGHGNCGSRVAGRAAGFGMRLLLCDPPLAERDASFRSCSLDEALGADFVTFHVPLTRQGESAHPTYHMVGEAELARMRAGAYLINTSRGAVVDSAALIAALSEGTIAGAVLDVYEGEPEPPEALIRLSDVATPHVAGYAIEAKRRGATVIYEQTCRALGLAPMETGGLLLRGFDPPRRHRAEFDASGAPDLATDRACRRLLGAIYEIDATSRELKGTLSDPRRGERFDRMRKDYEAAYARHELACYRVGFDRSVPDEVRAAVARRLSGLGMIVTGSDPHYILAPA